MKTAILAGLLLWGAVAEADSQVQVCVQAVDATVEEMHEGIDVDVVYLECGQINAGYQALTHRLIICTEALELPAPVLRTVVAHEMAHAIIDQLGIPVPGSEEPAADELGAISQIVNGHSDDVAAAADFYNGRDDGGEDVEDDHQSSAKRAAVLKCLVAGADLSSSDFVCRERFVHAAQVWFKLLTTFHK